MDQKTYSLFDFKFYEPEQKQHKGSITNNEIPALKAQHERQQQPKIAGALSASSTELVNPLSHYSSAAGDSPQSTQKYYCAACKKRFSNEATFTAHQQSDKHKKAVRAAGSSASHLPKAQTANAKSEEYHPVVKSALPNIKKAQAVMHKDPSIAATVFWNIAKDVAQYGNHSITMTCLENTKRCLDDMNYDPSLRGTKGSTAFWSPRLLLKTSLECHLALARLAADSDISKAAEQYKSGLCQFLGIQHTKLDFATANNHNPTSLEKIAKQIVADIPRKFSKEEDIEQACAAIKEVASALILFSGGNTQSILAGQGLVAYFVAYCFALSRDRSSGAYDCIKKIIDAYRFLSAPHMASECAMFVIRYHTNELDSKALVASSVVDSILSNDLVRARELIKEFNTSNAEPWSVYLEKLVYKSISTDVPWLSGFALTEWQQVAMSHKSPHELSVKGIISTALEQHILAPYIFYTPLKEI